MQNGKKMATMHFPLFPLSIFHVVNAQIFHAHGPRPMHTKMMYGVCGTGSVATENATFWETKGLHHHDTEESGILIGGSAKRKSR